MNTAVKLKGAQSGFSLVELIIAIGLSAALMFGVLQIFDANKQSTRMQHAMVEVQESGRIAAEMLTRDIRMADFWGCMGLVSNINNTIDTSSHPELKYETSTGVEGTFNTASGTTVTSGSTTITLVPGSDSLTLRTAASVNDLRINKTKPPSASIFQIENNAGVSIPQGMVLLVTDCTDADMVITTAATTGDGGNSQKNIHHGSGNNNPYASNKNGQDGKVSKSYGADAQLYQAVTRRYFVGRATGATVDSLYLQENGGTPEELIRHVSDLQLTYGLDSDNDKVVDTFDEAPSTTAKFESALSIRAVVTTHSKNSVASGSVLSRDFTVTSNIRNRIL